MNKISLIILIAFICYNGSLWSQYEQDIEDFEKIEISENTNNRTFEFARNEFKTYKVIFSGLFLFYKNYMSSQDAGHCPFQISCSEYMMKSIIKKGVIFGFLNGIDRYMRCNGKSNDKYKKDFKTMKLYDPVEY